MDEFDLELDELADQAAVVGKLTPREYAQLRGMAPQLIYYHLRQKHFEIEICICGRKVVDVKTVDEFFEGRKK